MKPLRKRTIWILLTLFLLPLLAFGFWYGRQVRQHRLDYALIEAIKKNDTPAAISLLNEGADANTTDRPYQPKTLWSVLKEFWDRSKTNPSAKKTEPYPSALYIATCGDFYRDHITEYPNNPSLVKALLEHGADPNVENEPGSTPLRVACSSHDLETTQLLLQHGANINQSHEGLTTPLMWACCFSDTKQVPCLRLLAEYGADVNATDSKGWTALIYCLVYFDEPDSGEAVRYLLEQGAKVSFKDKEGKTARDHAIAKLEIEMIPLLEAALKKELAQKGGRP